MIAKGTTNRNRGAVAPYPLLMLKIMIVSVKAPMEMTKVKIRFTFSLAATRDISPKLLLLFVWVPPLAEFVWVDACRCCCCFLKDSSIARIRVVPHTQNAAVPKAVMTQIPLAIKTKLVSLPMVSLRKSTTTGAIETRPYSARFPARVSNQVDIASSFGHFRINRGSLLREGRHEETAAGKKYLFCPPRTAGFRTKSCQLGLTTPTTPGDAPKAVWGVDVRSTGTARMLWAIYYLALQLSPPCPRNAAGFKHRLRRTLPIQQESRIPYADTNCSGTNSIGLRAILGCCRARDI